MHNVDDNGVISRRFMPAEIDQIPAPKRRLLTLIKMWGSATVADLATELGLSGEAVRQQLAGPERDLWIERENRPRSGEAGRPASRYRLTVRGERLFPKDDGSLAIALMDAVRSQLGESALTQVLGRVTDFRVAALTPAQEGAGPALDGRIDALRAIYSPGDPYLEVEKTEDGYRLTERNCPFLDVALQRPLLCSSTVSVLSRLVGRRVVRERRFQEGHGCCVFRIYADQPTDLADRPFSAEPALTPVSDPPDVPDDPTVPTVPTLPAT